MIIQYVCFLVIRIIHSLNRQYAKSWKRILATKFESMKILLFQI